MKTINYSYNLSPELFREGVDVTEMYNVSRTRQIVITVLCAFIVCNSVYGFIAAQKINPMTLLFLVLAVLIDLYIWFGPELQIKKLIKLNATNEVINIEIGENGIMFGNGDTAEKVYIEPNRFRGYRENENMYVFFFNKQYAILPKTGKSAEELDFTKEFLENYRNFRKTEETEFEIFKPDDGFVGEFDEPVNETEPIEELNGETNKKGSN